MEFLDFSDKRDFVCMYVSSGVVSDLFIRQQRRYELIDSTSLMSSLMSSLLIQSTTPRSRI